MKPNVILLIGCIFAITFLFLCGVGIFLLLGKGANLISGYNTMSPAEKAQYDEKRLCRAVGVMTLLLAGCFAVFSIGLCCAVPSLWIGGILAFILVLSAGLVLINTSPKIRHKQAKKH